MKRPQRLHYCPSDPWRNARCNRPFRVLLLAMEIPPNYGARYTRAFRESFRQVASETGASAGPFILATVATDPALMQADGIHPTVQAQPKLLEIVLPEVEALL